MNINTYSAAGRRLLVSGLFAALLLMGCTANKMENGYVAPVEIKVENGELTPEALLAFGRISDPQLSPDGSTILYGVTYFSIEKNSSCRNLWACDADGANPRQISRYAKSVNCARWSGDGKYVFFVQDGQLCKAPWLGNKLGKKEVLSDVKNKMGEFRISPDGALVLYTSTVKNEAVQQAADIDPKFDKAQVYVTEDLMYRHWDHWVTDTPRTFVSTMHNGTITADNSFDILGDEKGIELPTEPWSGAEQLCWAPDSRHIAYSCRKLKGKQYAFSTNSDIFIYDILTGQTVPVTCGGGYDTDPVWSEDGKHLAWISMKRDGYEADRQRLMVADIEMDCIAEDGQCNNITVSNVRDLTATLDRDASGICWKGDSIYFSALESEAVQAIYRVSLEGELQRVTPAGWNYDFFTPFAVVDTQNGTRLLSSYYCFNFPIELVAIDLDEDGASFFNLTNQNDPILSKLSEIGQSSEHITTVDGKDMQAWVLYPPQFDSTKVYPAIEIVLGGPQGTNSQDWSYRWCYRLMAQKGYIVILPNRRGTTAFGQEWKEQISGDYCGLNMQDYLSAGRWIKSKPYVGKLACCGASYGGYSAYMLEGLHGDLYDCFIAHAGIFDEKMLWFTTEEMWFANWDNGGLTEYAYEEGQVGPKGDGITFGGMQQAGAPYASTPRAQRHYANSPASMVTNWHTPILCIHGMLDFRIPYSQAMAAFNAAQMMGVPSKLVIFPEENHWILQPQNSLLWHKEFFDWLDRWCK